MKIPYGLDILQIIQMKECNSYLEKVRRAVFAKEYKKAERDSKLSYDRSLDRILPANGRSWN